MAPVRLFPCRAMPLALALLGCADSDSFGGGAEEGEGESEGESESESESEGCGDGTCQPAENAASCAPDCPTSCGDGLCTGTETYPACDDCFPEEGFWTAVPAGGPVRNRQATVWAPEPGRVLLWGGCDDTGCQNYVGEGWRYDPSKAEWSVMSSADEPGPRIDHGSAYDPVDHAFYVWGGLGCDARPCTYSTSHLLDTGAKYLVGGDRWTSIPSGVGARGRPVVVWGGDRLYVWGGNDGTSLNTGATLVRNGSAWAELPDAPAALQEPCGAWAWKESWGGMEDGRLFIVGEQAGPALVYSRDEGWNQIPNDLGLRCGPSCAWTGTEFCVWGGTNCTSGGLGSGSCFDPDTSSWRTMVSEGAPEGRRYAALVWAPECGRLIAWGGDDGSGVLDSGRTYDPDLDEWHGMADAPITGRTAIFSAVWTGPAKGMFVWGGNSTISGSSTPLGDGGSFRPCAAIE